jgi:hypothetical protein
MTLPSGAVPVGGEQSRGASLEFRRPRVRLRGPQDGRRQLLAANRYSPVQLVHHDSLPLVSLWRVREAGRE